MLPRLQKVLRCVSVRAHLFIYGGFHDWVLRQMIKSRKNVKNNLGNEVLFEVRKQIQN
jgi:hypothetical protein